MNQLKEKKKQDTPQENNLAQSLLYNTPLPNGQATTLDTVKAQTSPDSLTLSRQINSNAYSQGSQINGNWDKQQ